MVQTLRDSAFYKGCQHKVNYIIEEVPLYLYLVAFLIVVVGSAWIYYFLTPMAQGLGQNGAPIHVAKFGTSVYFSIVTITTLGYGDYHPIGLSCVIASFEVVFGLAFFGIVVAKITSRRLSYHVEKLFSSQAKKDLESHAAEFDQIAVDLGAQMAIFANAFTSTPPSSKQKKNRASNNADTASRDIVEQTAKFSQTLIKFELQTKRVDRYLTDEVEQGNYFEIVSPDAIRELGMGAEKALVNLGLLITVLSTEKRALLINGERRTSITSILAAHQKFCDWVDEHCENQETINCFRQLASVCKELPKNYFASGDIEPARPPDQVLTTTFIDDHSRVMGPNSTIKTDVQS